MAAAMMAAGCDTLDEDGYYYERSGPDDIHAPAFYERSPTAEQLYAAYPSDALFNNVEARVMLLCTVQPSRALSCTVENEGVSGWGFGAAALKVSQLFLVAPGIAASRQRVRVPIRFEVAE
jgi:hypothetical protein